MGGTDIASIVDFKRGGGGEEVVGVRVKALSEELLLDARVPKVLDLIVGPTGQVLGYLRPPVAKNSVHVNDGPLFLGRE